MRPISLLLLLASLSFASALELLENIQTPPSHPLNAPQLSPLLKDSGGQNITAEKQWLKKRKALKQQWQSFMGEFPKWKAPLKTEVLAKEELPEFTRELVKYQIEGGVFTDGYLLTPKIEQKIFPAIVVFHPTTPFQARGVAGLEPDYAEEKQQGIQLAQRGYVVWCPRNFIFDEGTGTKPTAEMWTANTEHALERHKNWTAMTRMTLDAIRAADFVASLPNVDKNRIGCIGHSLGGKIALYAPAFDERYKASVSSEGGIGLKFSNWDAAWYLGPKIKEPGFPLENHQILSLIAPRAFLLLAGDSADSDKSWAFIKAAMPVYRLFDATENIGWFNHHQGHRYSPEAREVAEAFLDAHLKK